jgi:quercetin dioxygenase-like cupin family protein
VDTPLKSRIHPQGLHMLVTEGNLQIAQRRQARDVHVGDLFAVARGVKPGALASTTAEQRS